MAKEQTYKKLSQINHIILRPETYLGSINPVEEELFTVTSFTSEQIIVQKKTVQFVPAFLKIFDEIITNASDHSIRTGEVREIKITLADDHIVVANDGPSVPIMRHDEQKNSKGDFLWIPELIFFHLLSGSNFNDNEERYVGGRNGLGSKLCNIFSNSFTVETCDGKQHYMQTSGKNLSTINVPVITKKKGTKSYTRITFYPDFERFGMKKLEDDVKSLLVKRALDIAVYCPTVKISVNNVVLPINGLKDYMKMHLAPDAEIFYESMSNGWELGVAQTTGDAFQQVSIVNGITTYRGGTHVNKVALDLSNDLIEQLTKGNKKLNIKNKDVKDKLFLFLVCRLPNPTFDTQTKENLTNYISKEIYKDAKFSAGFIKKIMKSQIVESILSYIDMKKRQELSKLNKNLQKVKVEKLIDAKGKDRLACSCRIFEGDSATSAFRKFRDSNTMGAYPIRGKFLNTSDLSADDITNNKEVKELVSTLGLNIGEKYNPKNLRYGSIYISSDADCLADDTNIKTESGVKAIKDVTINDKVLTHTGLYKKVKQVIETYKEESIEISVAGNSFRCSLNHILIVVRDGEAYEIKAHELKCTDFILLKNK